MRHRLFPLLIPLSLVGTPLIADTASAPEPVQEVCHPNETRIIAPDGAERAVYRVLLADTPEEREKGLMGVSDLPINKGMLFLFDRPGEVAFWMHETLIPLDMIFIDAHGHVASIHEGAIPGDETQIWSGGPVLSVLELNGGEVVRSGISIGDQIGSPFFPNGCTHSPKVPS